MQQPEETELMHNYIYIYRLIPSQNKKSTHKLKKKKKKQ